jgi:hypothetical protein
MAVSLFGVPSALTPARNLVALSVCSSNRLYPPSLDFSNDSSTEFPFSSTSNHARRCCPLTLAGCGSGGRNTSLGVGG